jgi:hypothetical protein
MKTEWVKVCVRPEQSFTRAILEIYMNDGGTLGEVIHALRRQKQYRIIQVSTGPQETEAVQDHPGQYRPLGDRNSTGSYRSVQALRNSTGSFRSVHALRRQ